jgi:hypothetical protein
MANKIKHDHKCDICGKPAKINRQEAYNTYAITPGGDFIFMDDDTRGGNEFFCKKCWDKEND